MLRITGTLKQMLSVGAFNVALAPFLMAFGGAALRFMEVDRFTGTSC